MIAAMRPARRWCVVACILAAAAGLSSRPAAAAEYALAPDDRVVGEVAAYVARSGDNLADIARHFDIGYTEMLAANRGIDPWSPEIGRRLTIPSRYILPDAPRRGIVINLGERRLYYFPTGGDSVLTYPIGIGVIGRNTPHSSTRVVRKEADPVWVPPPSIRAVRPDLPGAIGPGPDNPLGAFALALGWPRYLIHGTNKPDGVGRNVSHGCIHLYPEDIEELYDRVEIGAPVLVVDHAAAASWAGAVLYLAVHPDKEEADRIDMDEKVTPRAPDGLRELVASVAGPYSGAVDWALVENAGMERSGLPVAVAQRPAEAPVATAAAPPAIAAAPPAIAADDPENGDPEDGDEGSSGPASWGRERP